MRFARGLLIAIPLSLLLWAIIACGIWVAVANAQLINGTAADDYLVGTSGGDDIYGKDGKDEIHARAGDDFLVGGRGNDLLEGEGGKDYLQGDRGNDVLYAWGGTSGIDTITCGGGSDDWAYVGPLDIVRSGCEHVQVLP